ncbi:MAG TPA: hypothetical protein PKL14_11210 [Holophaga sp.]|nr:hypothetical protein [Holophaga sp.]
MRALSSLTLFVLPLLLASLPAHATEAPQVPAPGTAASPSAAPAAASIAAPIAASGLALGGGHHAGPSVQSIKGVGKAPVTMAPYWVTGGIKALLKDVPGAVVTVEDTLDLMPHLSTRSLMNGKMRLTSGQRGIDALAVPAPDWMNPMAMKSGGNVVQRSYGFGGLQF